MNHQIDFATAELLDRMALCQWTGPLDSLTAQGELPGGRHTGGVEDVTSRTETVPNNPAGAVEPWSVQLHLDQVPKAGHPSNKSHVSPVRGTMVSLRIGGIKERAQFTSSFC